MGEASSDSGAHAPSAYIWYAFAAAFLSTVGAGGVKLAFSNLLAADLLGRLCPIADSPCYKIFAFVATALQLGAVVAVNAAALQCSLTAMHRSSTPTAMVLINGFTFALGSVGGALLLGERAALTPRALFGAACVAAGLLVLVGSRTGEAAGSSTRTGDATASHGPRARTLSLVVAPVRAPRAAWDGAGVCAALRVGTAVVCVIAMLACQYYIVFAGA